MACLDIPLPRYMQALPSAAPVILGSMNDHEVLELLRAASIARLLYKPQLTTLLDEIFWTREKAPLDNKPFKSEDALNEAMALKCTHGGPSPRPSGTLAI